MLKNTKSVMAINFNYQTNNGQRKTPEIGKEILAVDPNIRPTEVDFIDW
jgi:hypothetical protein